MRGGAFALLLIAAAVFAAGPARAADPPVVASPKPDHVAISLYRDPNRDTDSRLPSPDEEEPLGGFALIRETRTVDLPPGPVMLAACCPK